MLTGGGQNKLNLSPKQRQGVVKISIFITSIFVIFISISYAFIDQTLMGIKRQIIVAGNLGLEFEEGEELSLANALPIYDEVGMIQKPFIFKLVNSGKDTISYRIKLVKIETDNELALDDVRYCITKNEQGTPDFLSNLQNYTVDSGKIAGGETINYTLRLWIRDDITEEEQIFGKSLKLRIDMEAGQKIVQGGDIQFDSGEGRLDFEPNEVIVGLSYGKLPTPTREGYTFDGWYNSKDKLITEETIAKEDDGVITAKWRAKKYTITFDANGGSLTTLKKEVTYAENYGVLPVSTRSGYKFLGWFTAVNGGSKVTTTTKMFIASDQTLYAHWEPYPLLSTMKQGDYVAYVGNNGCRNNGVDTTGTGEAESKNSCLGWNANQQDVDTTKFGYCGNSSYKYTTVGWRIAYIEDNRAYLISAGSPECNKITSSSGNANYIAMANSNALKYCNIEYVDGSCNNANAWAIGNQDFNKIGAQFTSTAGGYLYVSITGATKCGDQNSLVCGQNNDLLDNGGYYWFATTATNPTASNGVCWSPRYKHANLASSGSYGLRPIIRLSSSVYITGGSGTMQDPYTIAND